MAMENLGRVNSAAVEFLSEFIGNRISSVTGINMNKETALLCQIFPRPSKDSTLSFARESHLAK